MRYEAMEEHSLGRKSTLKVREVFWGPYQSSRAGLVTRKDVYAEERTVDAFHMMGCLDVTAMTDVISCPSSPILAGVS